jgi:hypothetical protein
MIKRAKFKIAELLTHSHALINNSLSDETILALVGKFGYGREQFEEGLRLHAQAVTAVESKQAAFGEQLVCTRRVEETRQRAEEAYQELAAVARAVLSDVTPGIHELHLDQDMPRSTAAFSVGFDIMIAQAQYMLEEGSPLGDVLTLERLAAMQDCLQAYTEADHAQEAAKGDAQQATRDQDEALLRLWDWVRSYQAVARLALRKHRRQLRKLGIGRR